MLNKNQNKTHFGILYSPILALSFYLSRHVDGGTKEPMRLADNDAFASHWEKVLFCYQLKDRKEAHAHFNPADASADSTVYRHLQCAPP